MTVEQIVLLIGSVLTAVGTVGTIYGTIVKRRLGLSSNENTAKKDLNSTWESIVKSLQAGQAATDKRLNEALARLDQMERRQEASDTKERLLYSHIFKLEAGYPPPVPARPEGI